MSWFVGEDGQQLWVARDETVYTVVEHEGELPLENLTYLSLQTKKSVYHECIYQEDLLAEGKSRVPRRQREHHSGRQRGFILRAEEESPLSRVVPWFKATAQKLVDDGEVSRVDADEAANLKKKKKDDKEKKAQLNLGANECHVETNARVHHFAHGPGFRVEVMQGNVTQRIHFFTNRKQLSCSEWNALLSEAIESTGNHVMVARRPQNAEAEQGAEGKAGPEGGGLRLRTRTKKSKAQQDDDAWLASMMKMAPAVGSDQESEESEEEEEESEEEEDEHEDDLEFAAEQTAAEIRAAFLANARGDRQWHMFNRVLKELDEMGMFYRDPEAEEHMRRKGLKWLTAWRMFEWTKNQLELHGGSIGIAA
mmetsp:Transcript_26820/g.80804  ORF Transcript_26820/g.80804 Transcript_26820/m.80804 type:complete len:366 (+) Transcript_26820:135-1232(+)